MLFWKTALKGVFGMQKDNLCSIKGMFNFEDPPNLIVCR